VTGVSDEQLMQAAAGGDFDAFEEIVQRYRQHAWRTAYRFLGDAMEAEDVAQESFLKILEAAPRYRPTAAFRTYFYRILTHLCIDSTRKKKQLPGMDNVSEVADPSLGPTESLIEKERGAQVREALDALPPHGRIRSEVPPSILTHRNTVLMSFRHTPG
jgi:RNA polymerase sigma-70 factor (ECF subfamily)